MEFCPAGTILALAIIVPACQRAAMHNNHAAIVVIVQRTMPPDSERSLRHVAAHQYVNVRSLPYCDATSRVSKHSLT